MLTMKRFFQIIIFLLFSFIIGGCGRKEAFSPNNELLVELDAAIVNTQKYDSTKIITIKRLKTVQSNLTPVGRFDLNKQLFMQYKSFICDSALYYIDENIAIAKEIGREDLLVWALIEKADLISKAGLFSEALVLLDSISSRKISGEMKEKYFLTYETTYQYMHEYTFGSEYSDKYIKKVSAYRDSVLQTVLPESFTYITEYGSKLIEKRRFNEAIDLFISKLDKYASGTREYSVMASILAYAYQRDGNRDLYEKYIALSAISDIKGCIKENLAIRSLAELCFDTGDIERAHSYLLKSVDDANYFSARMRKNQSANALPLITQTYGVMQEHAQLKLKYSLVVISLLAICLIIALFYIFKQLRLVSRSLKLVSDTKDKLLELNQKLSQANVALTDSNAALIESSRIKEEYIGKFMELCSIYISTLEQYRKTLAKQASKGHIEELYSLLRSEDIIHDTLKDFYEVFDTAFLNIYPHFVDDFNSLFPVEDQIVLKRGEKLNTELRTFALIRLGITGSDKIAQFLRCSITTAYTYRSKRKKRSIHPETFDEDILKIGL